MTLTPPIRPCAKPSSAPSPKPIPPSSASPETSSTAAPNPPTGRSLKTKPPSGATKIFLSSPPSATTRLYGNEKTALANYFHHFPDLHESRYYSVRAANALILVLDSSLDELSGPQGQWLTHQLDNLPAGVDFVFFMLHHPPYTSSNPGMFGEGHKARMQEMDLAKMLEARQSHTAARFVVFAGHVHNYERHEHGGVTYFVSGGAGAHAYPIPRAPSDPYQSKEINYHYLLVEVDRQQVSITMNRLQLENGKEVWTQPDSIKIAVPAAASATAGSTH